jgi:hypothetical protein
VEHFLAVIYSASSLSPTHSILLSPSSSHQENSFTMDGSPVQKRSRTEGVKVALITGITGQDGSYLAELLIEKGYEVRGG